VGTDNIPIVFYSIWREKKQWGKNHSRGGGQKDRCGRKLSAAQRRGCKKGEKGSYVYEPNAKLRGSWIFNVIEKENNRDSWGGDCNGKGSNKGGRKSSLSHVSNFLSSKKELARSHAGSEGENRGMRIFIYRGNSENEIFLTPTFPAKDKTPCQPTQCTRGEIWEK